MQPPYEEKTFESYFNSELNRKAPIYFPFGQVQEGSIGADASFFSRNHRLWWRLGYPFIFHAPFSGVDIREIAAEMERCLGQEIRNIPSIKANLLFQYKRPRLITNKRGLEWIHWNQKYFRYDIFQEQQELLEHIATKFGHQALVLYASPALGNIDELVDAKQRGLIIESTNFRPAQELTGHHRNTYTKAGTHSIACSEPERLEQFDLLSTLKQLESTRSGDNLELVLQFTEDIRAIAKENNFFGRAFQSELQAYNEAGIGSYPLYFSMISMSIFKELTGVQWILATSEQ